MSSWIEQTHPEYPDRVRRAQIAWDFFTGDALDVARRQADSMADGSSSTSDAETWRISSIAPINAPTPGRGANLGTYLYRRSQGESPDAFKERARISRMPMFFNALVGSFVGSIRAVDDQAKRRYFDGLGSPDDLSSFWGRFTSDCDGSGSSIESVMDQIAVALTVDPYIWYAVLPPAEDTGTPRLVVFPTESVTNWMQSGAGLSEVVATERVDPRETLRDEINGFDERYVHYTLDGYERYTVDGGTEKLLEDESAQWAFPIYTDVDRRYPRIPLAQSRLPLRYHVGYRVAQDNEALYNHLSDIRMMIRIANHPKLRGRDMEAVDFEATMKQIREGTNALLGDWDFISPDPANASVGYDLYEREVRSMFVSWFQMYNDSPKEITATQADIDDQRGRTAFLSILSQTLDDIENDVYFLASQMMLPGNPDTWRQTSVQRSTHFKPVSPHDLAQKQLAIMQGWSSLGWGRRVQLDRAGIDDASAETLCEIDAETVDEDQAEQ